MKRLVKHQPERLDSVVGFACTCSTHCSCSGCICSVSCTCACPGGSSVYAASFSGEDLSTKNKVNNGVSSANHDNTYSGVSTNVSLWP